MKFARYMGIVAFTLLTTLSGWFWYTRYYIWKECFNEKGRCYDPDSRTVYLEQAGEIWGGATGLFLCVTLFLLYRVYSTTKH